MAYINFFYFSWSLESNDALNVAYGNSFSNQWAFTMLETEVFKYNFLNFYTAKTDCIFC